MLKGLRKNQKWITIAIAIIFILGMAVMGISGIFSPKPYVGKIYGKKIYFQDYDRLLRQYISQYAQQNPGQEIDEQTIQRISDEFWQRHVSQTIMQKQFKKYHIKVTDNDVVNKMKNDPPAELLRNPEFQTNGVFDQQKYLNLLTTNEEFASLLENYMREVLPYELLEKKIKSMAKVVPDSARIEYIEKNNKISGQLIYFDYNTIPSQTVTDKEIKTYYDANKNNEYKKEPSAKYKYVKIPFEPSKEDAEQAKIEIDNIYNDIEAGNDFAELAKSYSQDPGSAANGGDLGFFGKGAMVKEFEDNAFALKVGEVSKPFQTNYGWHILKVTGQQKNSNGDPEVQASHILIPIKPSEQTKMEIRDKAEDLYELAKKDGLDKAAKSLDIAVSETMEFEKTAQSIPMLGRYPHLISIAFKKGVGHVEKPLKIYDGSYVVAEVSSKQGQRIDDLENVTDAIKFKLEKEKRIAKAADLAEEFVKSITPDKFFEQAQLDGWKIINFDNINIGSSISEIGLNKELNTALFDLKLNKASSVIKTQNGAFVGLVNVKADADMQVWESDKTKLTEEYKVRKESQYYSEWYRKVMDEAKVEDLRYLYY